MAIFLIGIPILRNRKKGQEFTEYMLDKLLSGYDNETTRLRRYKNLPRQPRHQISRLHLRNNPVHLYCQCLLYPGLYLFVWIETEALLYECF